MAQSPSVFRVNTLKFGAYLQLLMVLPSDAAERTGWAEEVGSGRHIMVSSREAWCSSAPGVQSLGRHSENRHTSSQVPHCFVPWLRTEVFFPHISQPANPQQIILAPLTQRLRLFLQLTVPEQDRSRWPKAGRSLVGYRPGCQVEYR